MQAVMLAAGMGKRLKKYTKDNTKCMLKVEDKTLIERAIEALLEAGVKKIIIVVGYKGENLKKFLLEECENPLIKEIEIEFIDNDVYDKTNNIYSLALAKDELVKDDTILLESDLIYDYKLIKLLVDSEDKNLVSVAKYEQWMDGTVIKIDQDRNVLEFIEKKDFSFDQVNEYYKTVNVYKFSKEFLKNQFLKYRFHPILKLKQNYYDQLLIQLTPIFSYIQIYFFHLFSIYPF